MIKDSLYTLFTRIFYIIGKIIYSVVINRTLGPEGKGLFELIQLGPNVLSSFGTFGFNESNTYFSGKKPEKIPNIIGNSYRLAGIFSIIAIILGAGFLFLKVNRGMFTEIPMWVGFLALLVIPIILLDLFLECILYGENRIWVRNWHEILRIVSGILFMGFFVIILNWYVQGAVYGYLLIHTVLLIFTFVILSRFHKPAGGKLDKPLVKESWMFARFSWGANFAQYLLLNIDRWLIFLLVAENIRTQQVGLYSTAANVMVNIWIIPASIQTALIPKITQKGESERKKLVPPSLRIVTILVILAIAILVLIGKPALDILYNRPDKTWDFTMAYIPMMLLIPGIFSMSFAKVFAADFFSRGKPYISMWVSIFALFNNVWINLVLIPSDWTIGSLYIGGMNGAAIASSIAYTLSFILFLYLYVKESGEKSRDLFIPKKVDFETIWAWVVISLRNLSKKNTDGGDA